MKKKGFTLIEIVIVFSIMILFMGMGSLNFIKITWRSKVDSFSNQTATIIKEAYENSNKEMDFSSWNVEIENNKADTEKLTIRLKKLVKEENINIKEITLDKMELKSNSISDFTDTNYYISFNQLGDIKIYKGKFNENNRINQVDNFSIDLYNVDNPSYKKIIEIKSIPPGNISVR